MAVVTSSFLQPVSPGDVAASFRGPGLISVEREERQSGWGLGPKSFGQAFLPGFALFQCRAQTLSCSSGNFIYGESAAKGVVTVDRYGAEYIFSGPPGVIIVYFTTLSRPCVTTVVSERDRLLFPKDLAANPCKLHP